MPTNKIIVLIEDELVWRKRLSTLLKNALDCNVEEFGSFLEAETRILQKEKIFDLLITDIYESEFSKETKGITIANYVKKFLKIPVIVITGEDTQLRPSYKNDNVDDTFDKAKWDSTQFIQSVRTILEGSNEFEDGSKEHKAKNEHKTEDREIPKGTGRIY